MSGKPVTAFLVTALILYAIWLWRQGRLGHVGGGAMVPAPGPKDTPANKMGWPPEPFGWTKGTPPVLPRNK